MRMENVLVFSTDQCRISENQEISEGNSSKATRVYKGYRAIQRAVLEQIWLIFFSFSFLFVFKSEALLKDQNDASVGIEHFPSQQTELPFLDNFRKGRRNQNGWHGTGTITFPELTVCD